MGLLPCCKAFLELLSLFKKNSWQEQNESLTTNQIPDEKKPFSYLMILSVLLSTTYCSEQSLILLKDATGQRFSGIFYISLWFLLLLLLLCHQLTKDQRAFHCPDIKRWGAVCLAIIFIQVSSSSLVPVCTYCPASEVKPKSSVVAPRARAT